MSYNYRCSARKCQRRRTLKRKIENYIRVPCCLSCGSSLRDVTADVRKYTQQRLCKCGEVHGEKGAYPHRKGTEPWCKYAKIGPTAQDWEDRYGRR